MNLWISENGRQHCRTSRVGARIEEHFPHDVSLANEHVIVAECNVQYSGKGALGK